MIRSPTPASPKNVSVCAPSATREPSDLDEAARQESGLGIISEAQPVANLRGDAEDVFQGPGELDADGVGIGVDPKEAVIEGVADRDIEAVVAPATTTEAGSPRASSSAWLGPLRTAIDRVPRISTTIWLGRKKVAFSIPFTTLNAGTPSGTRSSISTRVSRRNAEGIAIDDEVGPFGRVAWVRGNDDVRGEVHAGQMAFVLSAADHLGGAITVAGP